MINIRFRNYIIGIIVQIVLVSPFVLVVCKANAENIEYRLTAFTGDELLPKCIVGFMEDPNDELTDYQFPHINFFSSEISSVKVYFAEGTSVFVDNSMNVENEDHSVFAELPGLSGTIVRIDKSHLILPEDYDKVYEPPKMIINYREAVFESPYNSNHKIIAVLEPGDEVEIKAIINNEFLIYLNGEYGYIRQDGGFFKKDGYTYAGSPDSKNQYDSTLFYHEPYFQNADSSILNNFPEYIDEAMAIDYAMAYLEKYMDIDQLQSEGYSLKTYARLNSAHFNSPLGLTWQIIFYGNNQERFMGPSTMFVDFDNPNNTIIVLPIDLLPDISLPCSMLLMTDEDWSQIKNALGDDIQDRFVYFMVEVSAYTGDVIIYDTLLDTPYGRIAIYK